MDTAADQCSCGGPGWVVLDMTGENVTCNGYLKGNTSTTGTILPIVSAVTCVTAPNEEPFLLVVHQATYYDNPEQNESLCLPFQAEQHGVKFSLTPIVTGNVQGGTLGHKILSSKIKKYPYSTTEEKCF